MKKTWKDRVEVMVVEERGVVREALAACIDKEDRFKTVLVCAPGAALRDALAAGCTAAVALVGVSGATGAVQESVELLLAHHGQVGVAVYGEHLSDGRVVRFYRAGVKAVLLPTCGLTTLHAALHTVANGGVYHDADTQRMLLENPDGLDPDERSRQRLRAQLHSAQLQVLELICHPDDLTYDAIARRMRANVRSVHRHAADLMEVFGVKSKTALALSAVRLGMVGLAVK